MIFHSSIIAPESGILVILIIVVIFFESKQDIMQRQRERRGEILRYPAPSLPGRRWNLPVDNPPQRLCRCDTEFNNTTHFTPRSSEKELHSMLGPTHSLSLSLPSCRPAHRCVGSSDDVRKREKVSGRECREKRAGHSVSFRDAADNHQTIGMTSSEVYLVTTTIRHCISR